MITVQIDPALIERALVTGTVWDSSQIVRGLPRAARLTAAKLVRTAAGGFAVELQFWDPTGQADHQQDIVVRRVAEGTVRSQHPLLEIDRQLARLCVTT